MPLFHAGGLNSYSNPALYWGGHVTTIRRFDPERVLDLLGDPEVGVTHLCGVLQMYELITAHPRFDETAFPTLRTALFGGWGPKTVPVHEAWRERGFFLQLSYGATELGPIVSVLEDGAELASMNCSGTVVAGTQVRLVDGAGADVADGEVGEIWAKGPAVTPGYWNRPREDYFNGDWFRTGDCARRDPAGRLYIVDRLREVYRSGGENIYPAEVELALSKVPGIKEVAVIAVPDERWGEVGLAVVELLPGACVTLESSARPFGGPDRAVQAAKTPGDNRGDAAQRDAEDRPGGPEEGLWRSPGGVKPPRPGPSMPASGWCWITRSMRFGPSRVSSGAWKPGPTA